jgi:IS30 family transposase
MLDGEGCDGERGLRLGDFEGDPVCGKAGKGCIVTLVNRK